MLYIVRRNVLFSYVLCILHTKVVQIYGFLLELQNDFTLFFSLYARRDVSKLSNVGKAALKSAILIKEEEERFSVNLSSVEEWALTDSNRRPSACKADALNQLS